MKLLTLPLQKMFASISLCILLLTVTCAQSSTTPQEPQFSILVFSKTAGFYHKSIPAGLTALQKLGMENRFKVDTTKDASLFTADNLKKYKVVVFLSTTGNVLNEEQQSAFEKYIQNGGGFVGIHGAADTEYDWPWYNQLVGAYFLSHPKIQKATVMVVDKNHISTKHLPAKWERTDEWYDYKSVVDGLNILCKLDESTYEGAKMGENHPIAWYREFDGGRMFYTGGGHTDEAFKEPLFLQHVLGGIQYAAGVKVKPNKKK